MRGRLPLALIMFAIQINDAARGIACSPHHRRAVPAHIHAVRSGPGFGNGAIRNHDFAGVQRIDRFGSQRRFALRARPNLIRGRMDPSVCVAPARPDAVHLRSGRRRPSAARASTRSVISRFCDWPDHWKAPFGPPPGQPAVPSKNGQDFVQTMGSTSAASKGSTD